jgi:aspartate/methionine/tyrosine aminotransferase
MVNAVLICKGQMAGSASYFPLAMVDAFGVNTLYDTTSDRFIFISRKGLLMERNKLPPFRLERWFAEFEFVPGMRNLAASGPYAVNTRELLELEGPETTARYLNLDLDYIENPGSESLRKGVADLYTTLNASDVQITSGASEALLLLMWTLAAPGINIVIEEPCYGNVPGIAESLGIEVRRLPLSQEDDWKPDLEQLSRLIDEKTSLVYLVHPHNPTGSVLSREEMEAIASITERAGAMLVNDEVFRLITLDDEPIPSIVDVVENAVSIGDMTKPWGLGGLRVGWIASRRHELLDLLSSARDYSTMCSSAPGSFLAELVLRHSKQIIAPRLAAARDNRSLLADVIELSKGSLSWRRPEAGYTAFVQMPTHISTIAFCRRLAQEQGILLLPGEVYGSAYEQFIRIGFGCDPKLFQEGLMAFLEAM